MWSIACISAILWSLGSGLGPSCCRLANGTCRHACEGASLLTIATDNVERLRFGNLIAELCPEDQDLLEFWSCINDTLEDINRGDGWFGRPCCHKPKLKKCQLACLKAQSLQDLQPACRQSDEIDFQACLEKQDLGERCCNGAQTPECYIACKGVFVDPESRRKEREIKESLDVHCSAQSPVVLDCVRNVTHAKRSQTAHQKIHCCEHAPNDRCRSTCIHVLQTLEIEQEIMEGLLAGGCDAPMLHDKLWQCFLYSSKPKLPVATKTFLPSDGAKIQCCLRATTIECQRFCLKTYGADWGSYWETFHTKCQYHPAEVDMQNCLADVDEPCELGCDDLSYCTHFNRRPTELFHSCNARSDKTAEADVRLWSQGLIRLPVMDIPVRNVSTCPPEAWKAVACTLQLKPCHRHDHASAICKDDCVDILNRCVDPSRLKEFQTPYTLCEALAPPGENPPCISLRPYLEMSKLEANVREVTHPCRAHTCNASSICILKRKCSDKDYPCSKYQCVSGCLVGEASKTIVPRGTFVSIPTLAHDSKCSMVCRCSNTGTLQDCTPQPCTGTDEPCWLGGRKYPHNTRFTVDCSDCFCDSGKVTCTAGPCSLDDTSRRKGILARGLPCSCPKDYFAVCGSNGKTYPNACLARCAGVSPDHFKIGVCFDMDPCASNPCPRNTRCIVNRKVCLVLGYDVCKQYICVSPNKNCRQEPAETVCDTKHQEHYNLCMLFKRGSSLAHFGNCEQQCQQHGLVCGIDGETYKSECEAKAQRVLVDYRGPCLTVAVQDYPEGVNDRLSYCSKVRCAPLPSKACTPTMLRGVCCPVCGSALRIGYNEKLAKHAVNAAKTDQPMTLREILERLREQVYTSECDLFGYLDLRSNIIVVVVPVTKYPTSLQVMACQKEAQKLDTLIRARSPRLLSLLSLSVFTTTAEVHEETMSSDTAGRSPGLEVSCLLALFWSMAAVYLTVPL
ncbi:reversion-inducing cysteine-rich protein with Kazal motifs [Ixodes scapularis]|uniref:reversion-inducing cysteine-rich protein with Kazal motifs n=1 Tax=Ixodes scapularis TaxID=6945 RepID=UPI001AD672FE|nr:reversion-inducing cysteine-rich protein with Kazal motifs [Ixodes scapularis]